VAAGLISYVEDHPDANPHGQGAVLITDKGRAYLAQRDN
jgi:hypothetical protein